MKGPTTTAKSGGVERYVCNLMNINHWLYWPCHERKKKKTNTQTSLWQDLLMLHVIYLHIFSTHSIWQLFKLQEPSVKSLC